LRQTGICNCPNDETRVEDYNRKVSIVTATACLRHVKVTCVITGSQTFREAPLPTLPQSYDGNYDSKLAGTKFACYNDEDMGSCPGYPQDVSSDALSEMRLDDAFRLQPLKRRMDAHV
jgi:hypothetical protein